MYQLCVKGCIFWTVLSKQDKGLFAIVTLNNTKIRFPFTFPCYCKCSVFCFTLTLWISQVYSRWKIGGTKPVPKLKALAIPSEGVQNTMFVEENHTFLHLMIECLLDRVYLCSHVLACKQWKCLWKASRSGDCCSGSGYTDMKETQRQVLLPVGEDSMQSPSSSSLPNPCSRPTPH